MRTAATPCPASTCRSATPLARRGRSGSHGCRTPAGDDRPAAPRSLAARRPFAFDLVAIGLDDPLVQALLDHLGGLAEEAVLQLHAALDRCEADHPPHGMEAVVHGAGTDLGVPADLDDPVGACSGQRIGDLPDPF